MNVEVQYLSYPNSAPIKKIKKQIATVSFSSKIAMQFKVKAVTLIWRSGCTFHFVEIQSAFCLYLLIQVSIETF